MLAIRFHPLDPVRRQRRRDPHWLDDHLRYCCPAPPTGAWPAPTWWPASPPPPPPPACRPPPSPTTDRSTPHDSPTATTTSNACWPVWASLRKTVTPDAPRPKAKSNASTKPSNAGWPADP